jgi:acetoin utilization deacetylase AcuC-like enzyme
MIPVFFHLDAICDVVGTRSPSASKPGYVMENWLRKYSDQINVVTHEAAEIEELDAVHDPQYVRDVIGLRRNNGFGNRQANVPRSLMYTVGGMIHAAQAALEYNWGSVAVPYSGFHHAGRDYNGGFCTFNGLMAAAVSVLEQHMCGSVLILDCDYHYGDGTQHILDTGDLETAGIHHWSSGFLYHDKSEAEDFFAGLKTVLHDHRRVDLVLYQAGVDQHIRDPLGGLLTTKQMQRRDRMVFEHFNEHGVPVVWDLAGGYQQPLERTLALHDQTMRACIEANLG